MVHSFFVKLWPFFGLWQFVSLCSKRWDSFKMDVDDFRWICLCLVETVIGGPRWATWNHSSLEGDANLWLATLKVVKLVGVVAVPPGRAIRNPGFEICIIWARAAVYYQGTPVFLCHNTAGFNGLHWMNLYLFQWCPGLGHGHHADLGFWWRGVGIHIERKSRDRIPNQVRDQSFICKYVYFLCWRETINITPYCECRQTLLPHFYSGNCYYLFRLGRTGFSYAGGIYWHTRIHTYSGWALRMPAYDEFWYSLSYAHARRQQDGSSLHESSEHVIVSTRSLEVVPYIEKFYACTKSLSVCQRTARMQRAS